jgi:hypothetical protein
MAMHLHRRGAGGRSPGLAYGGLMHNILEWHYRSGGAFALVEATAEEWWSKNRHEDVGDYRTFDRGILDYRRYREKWGETPDDEQAQTIGWPDNPMVEIAAEAMGGSLIVPWAVKLDRIIELGGMHLVQDHKYTSRLDKNFIKSFELSNQMMGYTRTAQFLMPSLRIAGVQINIIHALKTGTNFERALFTYTREQLEEWELNSNEWARRIAADTAAWPTLEELHAGAAWPVGNFGSGCSRKYGLCAYHSICSKSPTFRARLLEEVPVNPWNPLEVDDSD